jgi:hypothetical protein
MDIGWIWADNLCPLFVELAVLAAYGFDDSDWTVVEHGVRGTDSDAGPWFGFR